MLSYCLKCRKNTTIKNGKVATTKNRRIMLLSKCVVCDRKVLIKDQKANGLLSLFRNKNTLSQIPLAGLLLFQRY